ncbi:RRP15 protein, partial [Nothocercus nigrocapillus]|nr:RRP15 protein [Nothocercus nigrocapillus]
SELSSGLSEDNYSSESEALEGDDEDETAACGDAMEEASNSQAGPSAGWADAMAKVLNKKIPQNKSTILSKSKKLEKEREKLKQERLEKRRKLDKKREWEMMCRVKPDVVKDRDRERNLQRIATSHVHEKYFATRTQTTEILYFSTWNSFEYFPTLRMWETLRITACNIKNGETKSEEGPEWNILRDDFMMGASMKDWDKESDGESSVEQGDGLKQESESD